ncbi:M28 family peptidase [Niveibacterium terrae]|uniref:M28 family peptidase n=1 Tax=Niveibacterium terrae TaxID=3373598 RepID=UPI003A95446A
MFRFKTSAWLLLGLCAAPSLAADPAPRMSPEHLLEHTRVLSSDEFAGRAPGTRGEELSVEYLIKAFKAAGAQPGNPDGSWVQKVPLLGIRSKPTVSFSGCAAALKLSAPDDYVAWTTHAEKQVTVKASDLVFVGYGVVAPEYGWDDYKGVDVRGKTLVMLINDPAIPDPADPTRLDERMFKGRAMTYYGRWTYKFEIAAARGAAGAIIIHETGPAAYPYEVVRNSNSQENITIRSADGNAGDVALRSWLREDKARALLGACGQDFDALKAAAIRPDFHPVPLAAQLDARIATTQRSIDSRNVVARIEGADPAHRDETLIYSAHWDHFGTQVEGGKTTIYHGALDNASAVATLVELARMFSTEKASLKRSVLFLAPTAEETGLLGSRWYAEHPLYPLAKTVADLNMDMVNAWGRSSDFELTGMGQTTLDDLFAREAAVQGRIVVPEAKPENGMYFRSDHLEFVRRGVPAMLSSGGRTLIGKSAAEATRLRDDFTAHRYHKSEDRVLPEWDLSGAAEDGELYYRVGRAIVRDLENADFSRDSEFRAARARLLSGS